MDRLDHRVRRCREKTIDLMRPWHRLRAAITVERRPMPAKANSGRSSLNANHTMSFFFFSGFGSGAYSAKLFSGTRHRFSGLSQPRQRGDNVLRMLVTGGPPVRGGGMPHGMVTISVPASALRTTGTGQFGNTPSIGARLPT
jgi:hypothetical protein